MKGLLHLRYAGAALVVIVAGLLVPVSARAAQPTDHLKSLTISVWLEYDRPGGLYIFRGGLADGTTLPTKLTFRVPGRTGGPSSTAAIDSSGQYRYVRPTLQEEGDTIVVEYETNWPQFQFEYYDDTLQRQGQHRQLEFSYRAEYPIDQLVLEIKEPYAASSVSFDPPADAKSQGEDGLTVHRRNVGPVAPGQEVRWKVSYNKSDARLSAEALDLPRSSSNGYELGAGTATSGQGQNNVLYALLALLGLVAVGGLAFTMRSGMSQPTVAKTRAGEAGAEGGKGRKRRAKDIPEPPQVRPAKYCFRCGAAMSKTDSFCRRCGSRRRGT